MQYNKHTVVQARDVTSLKLGSRINRISYSVHSQSEVASMILFSEFQRIQGKGTIVYLKVISRNGICVTEKNHEEVRQNNL